ncbi:glucosylceramidase [Catenulispora sp. MAP5-51]|uniref:ricin-type beta-trefoil lectin domain protein n=1 Tax=Catenulispora sp. MAP5-51 TaxID=3156298 RepID=UPI0035143141
MAAVLVLSSAGVALTQATTSFADTGVNVWLTTADQADKLTPQSPIAFGVGGSGDVITVNPDATYQSIVGFGGSLTDASAYNIWNSPSRDAIMDNLFGSGPDGISLSFLRQPVGTSDFSRSFYSLDDVGPGSSDPALSQFSIAKDQAYIIPLLQQARSLNPQLTFMGTPWSAPAWMKTNASMLGTKDAALQPGDEAVYAQYLTKFAQAYQAQGIPISYLSVANEPAWPPLTYPGMLMTPQQQSTVINDLAPDLAAAGQNTKLLAWDDNWDDITGVYPDQSYPKQVLAATGANTAGVAWHGYDTHDPNAQTAVHDAYPGTDVLETEHSWTSGTDWPGEITGQGSDTAIDALRNWSRTVSFWNIALDANGGPKTDGGPTIDNGCGCTAPVTTDGANVTYNAEYYVLGHFSKFVKPGALRIDSNVVGSVNNVAFENPDHSIALIADNTGSSAQTFQVSYKGSSFGYTLPAGAMATFTWPGGATRFGTITGHQGLCLDVQGANPADTTPVQVYTCNGTTAQTWTVEPSDNTVHALGKCLDVQGGATANGTPVQLYTCNGTGAQTWVPQGDGSLYNPQSGRCLDDTGGGASTTRTQIFDCWQNDNQQWNLP